MPTVGRTLAAERARQNRELADIAARTKINLHSLQAIESDDFDQLPGNIFARNFVRQYAQELGLEPMHIVAQFDREQSPAVPDLPAAPLPEPRIRIPRLSGPGPTLNRVLESNALSAFATFVLTIAGCGLAYYGYQHWLHRPAPNRPAPVTAAAETKAATPPPPSTPKTAAAAAAPADTSPVRVALTALEPCWTRIVADGKTLFAGLLTAGEQRTVDATATVTIRAGNAGALAIKLNGNDVPAIGPKGQIRTVTLTPAGAQVFRPVQEPVEDF